jgi:phenylacetate-CoA ligase
MPLIHYDLNDVGQFLEGTCSCGRNLSLMKSIEGRDNDIVKTASGELIPVHFFSYLFRDMNSVDQFQVIQEKLDRIVLKIVKNTQFSESDAAFITDKVRNKTGGQITVDFQYVDDIPVSGRSGKRRYVISSIPFPMQPDT